MKNLLTLVTCIAFWWPCQAQCWQSISYGKIHSAGIAIDGSLWTWGWNNYGQLGLGNTTPQASPTQVGTDMDWAMVSTGSMEDNNLANGGNHSMAIKTDGTLWAWGRNDYGQLGDGTYINKLAPVQIGTDTDWDYVECGALHTLALKTDSTLWSWGHNAQGQLGQGTITDNPVPTLVVGNTWLTVATAGEHNLGIACDSTLWSWGLNHYYQLGFFNDNTEKLEPTQVDTTAVWRSISTGRHYSFAIKHDNTLWGWGRNDNGQLGLGNTTSYHPVPEQIGTGDYWQEVDCGQAHTIAARTNGTLWGWGYNYDGQLGVGNNNFFHLSEQQIASGAGVVHISAGANSSASLRANSELWAWGRNWEGALGTGDLVDRNTPAMIGCGISVAVEGYEDRSSLVHPNPSTGWVYFGEVVDRLWLYNAQGQLLLQNELVDRLDLTQFGQGVYLLALGTKNDMAHTKLLVH